MNHRAQLAFEKNDHATRKLGRKMYSTFVRGHGGTSVEHIPAVTPIFPHSVGNSRVVLRRRNVSTVRGSDRPARSVPCHSLRCASGMFDARGERGRVVTNRGIDGCFRIAGRLLGRSPSSLRLTALQHVGFQAGRCIKNASISALNHSGSESISAWSRGFPLD
jgi:hypothetical protein